MNPRKSLLIWIPFYALLTQSNTMRIAAYNVENLFDRAKAFNEKTPE